MFSRTYSSTQDRKIKSKPLRVPSLLEGLNLPLDRASVLPVVARIVTRVELRGDGALRPVLSRHRASKCHNTDWEPLLAVR